jgi:hypothetical protein
MESCERMSLPEVVTRRLPAICMHNWVNASGPVLLLLLLLLVVPQSE